MKKIIILLIVCMCIMCKCYAKYSFSKEILAFKIDIIKPVIEEKNKEDAVFPEYNIVVKEYVKEYKKKTSPEIIQIIK